MMMSLMRQGVLLNRAAIAARAGLCFKLSVSFFLIAAAGTAAAQANLRAAVEKAVAANKKGAEIGIHLVDLEAGKEIYNFQASLPLKPASTLKIVVSAAALARLGPDYRFETKWAFDNKNNLYINGGGDPSLTTESLWLLARKIKKSGPARINQIILDSSAFKDPSSREGQRSYMTGSSALSFNHNSLAVEICPGKPGQPAKVSPDPWEVPVQLINEVKTVGVGSTSLNVSEVRQRDKEIVFKVVGKIHSADSCSAIYRSVENPPFYFAATLQRFLDYVGIDVASPFKLGAFPRGVKYNSHPSEPLSLIIRGLNHYSTNFIAEQLLYALGANREHSGFDRDKGLAVLEDYLKKLKIDQRSFSLHDASGLSHSNRLSAAALTTILSDAYGDPRISGDFIASLAVGGASGTLKKRYRFLPKGTLRAKTGSLNGVTTLAGYFFPLNGKRYAFAIIQNKVSVKDNAVKLEEAVIRALANS